MNHSHHDSSCAELPFWRSEHANHQGDQHRGQFDPVSGMQVKPDSQYMGETYRFCSGTCRTSSLITDFQARASPSPRRIKLYAGVHIPATGAGSSVRHHTNVTGERS
jgi:hypothetical protein